MVKAVVFDLYETLVTQSGTAVPRAGALGESLGLDPTAYRREWKQIRPRVLRGELTFAEALTQIGTRLSAAIPIERVQHARDERIRANTEVFQKIDPDLLALTRDLRARGVRLATISNCMAEDVVAWPTSAFAPQFAARCFRSLPVSSNPILRFISMRSNSSGRNPRRRCISATAEMMSWPAPNAPGCARRRQPGSFHGVIRRRCRLSPDRRLSCGLSQGLSEIFNDLRETRPAIVFATRSGGTTIDQDACGGNPFATALIELAGADPISLQKIPGRLRALTDAG